MPTYDPIIEWSAYELARRKREASTFEDRIEVDRDIARARQDPDFRARMADIGRHGRFQSGPWKTATTAAGVASLAPLAGLLPIVGSAIGPVGTGLGLLGAAGLTGLGAANVIEGHRRRQEGLPGAGAQMGWGAADVLLSPLGTGASKLLRGLRGVRPQAAKASSVTQEGPFGFSATKGNVVDPFRMNQGYGPPSNVTFGVDRTAGVPGGYQDEYFSRWAPRDRTYDPTEPPVTPGTPRPTPGPPRGAHPKSGSSDPRSTPPAPEPPVARSAPPTESAGATASIDELGERARVGTTGGGRAAMQSILRQMKAGAAPDASTESILRSGVGAPWEETISSQISRVAKGQAITDPALHSKRTSIITGRTWKPEDVFARYGEEGKAAQVHQMPNRIRRLEEYHARLDQGEQDAILNEIFRKGSQVNKMLVKQWGNRFNRGVGGLGTRTADKGTTGIAPGSPGYRPPAPEWKLYEQMQLLRASIGLRNRARATIKLLEAQGLVDGEAIDHLGDIITQTFLRQHHNLISTGAQRGGREATLTTPKFLTWLESIGGALAGMGLMLEEVFRARLNEDEGLGRDATIA